MTEERESNARLIELKLFVACKKELSHKRRWHLTQSSLDMFIRYCRQKHTHKDTRRNYKHINIGFDISNFFPEFYDTIVDCHICVTQRLLSVYRRKQFLWLRRGAERSKTHSKNLNLKHTLRSFRINKPLE